MKLFLTGKPRCGKSTVIAKVIEILKRKGLKVGGFLTPEKRVGNKRIGFSVKDIYSGSEGVLASVEQKTGLVVGKYRVNLEGFESIAMPALEFALKNCDLVCIDEIGKMEWFSSRFREKIREVLASDKTVVAVVHREFAGEFKKYGEVVEVTIENREHLPEEIVRKVMSGSAQN